MYGGTASEMARLINDSGVLGDAITVTADTVNDVSFSKIIEAIHTVQDNMGITGTTALEASETISGSVATMKSSWKNLVGAMANGDADIGYFVDNFAESAETAASNVLPAIETAIGGIGTLVQELGPKITAALPELLTTVLPGMVSAGISMLGAVGEGIVAAVPELVSIAGDAVLGAAEDIFGVEAVETATSALSTAFDTVKTKFTEVKEAVQPLVDAISDYITSGELANDVINAMETAFDTVSSVISSVVDGVKAFSDWCSEHQTTVEVMTTLVGSLTAAIGLYEVGQIAMNVATTAWSTISGIATAATTAFSTAVSFLTSPVTIAVVALAGLIAIGVAIAKNWDTIKETAEKVATAVGDFFHTLAETASNVWESIKTAVSSAMDAIGTAISDGWNAAIDAISGALDAIKDSVSNAWTAVTSTVSSAVNSVKNTVTSVFNSVKTTVQSIWNGIKTTISTTANAIKTTVTTVWNAIKTAITTPITAAKNTVSTIFSSIQSTISSKINAAKDAVKSAIDKIKGFFNFSWSLPHLKLPHITISGSFSLTPPSVPKFGISWYAKAMDNPMLLNGATIFGAMGGNFLGGGEAGTEVVSGANTLMNMMRDVTRGELGSGFTQLEQKIDQLLMLLAHITGTTININGADYRSKMELAQAIIDIITREQKRQEHAYG